MLNMIIDLLDRTIELWSSEIGILLYGIAIATSVLALFTRLRTPRRWKE